MRNLCFYAVLIAAIIVILSGFLGAADGEYPFSDIVRWDKKSKRQEYERLMKSAGFSLKFSMRDHSGSWPSVAKKQQCLTFDKDGALMGYGIVFEAFISPVAIINRENGDKREIDLHQADVLYDIAGRRIFLVSYSIRLSPGESFIAKFFMGKEIEIKRGIFRINHQLEEGYELDDASRRLAETLLRLPEACRS